MEIYWNEKLKGLQRDKTSFQKFLTRMSMRVAQGHARYGAPDQKKLYLKRIKLEVLAYTKTGNSEHLFNIANYCWLESEKPQNPKFHLDTSVGSATRGKV